MDKTAVFIILVIVIAGAVFWGWYSYVSSGSGKLVPLPEGIILFYGQDCPHCENVDEFLSQNNIEEKIKITHLEVYYNTDNQNILAQVMKKCEMQANQVGVPFLWDGEICTVGDGPIIEYFKNAANI